MRCTNVADMVYDTENQYYVTNNAKGNYIEYGRVDDTKFDAYCILCVRKRMRNITSTGILPQGLAEKPGYVTMLNKRF